VKNTRLEIVSALYNLTRKETNYSKSTAASHGDEIMYRLKLTNIGATTLTGLNVRICLSSALEYVPNYSRAIFFANGKDQALALNDAIASNGSELPINISTGNFIYIVYKARVVGNGSGSHRGKSQVWGDNKLNVSTNNAAVMTVSTQ
jgi:uncharacterized repeat protein (TIGR01451 family)